MFGTCPGSKHGEYPCATSHVKDNLPFEQVLVVVHGIPIGQSSHLVLQHLLMNTYRIRTGLLFEVGLYLCTVHDKMNATQAEN